MNKKTIIQITIIAIAFLGAGLILYNGLFKGSNPTFSTQSELEQDPGLAQETILPYGNKADFDILKKQNLFYNQVAYPKLDSKSEYGILKEDLMLLPPSK